MFHVARWIKTGSLVLAVGLLQSMLSVVPAQEVQEELQINPWLVVDGHEVEPAGVSVSREADLIAVRFVAPHDGVFSIGLSITAPSVTPLAPGLHSYEAADLDAPLVLRYPYDWTYIGTRNVLNYPRLVAPGLIVGDQCFTVDTHDLWSLRLEPTQNGYVRAILMAHRYYNDGADVASTQLPLSAGETVELSVRVSAAPTMPFLLQHEKPAQPDEELMVQVAYRGWTADSYGEAEYRTIADRLSGYYDWVIVREVETHDWIPRIFHERGIRVLAYQYIGALRRHSDQVSKDTEARLGMHGCGGELYTAPYSPDGPWLLADIRRPEVREVFTRRAVEAIEAGYDGIFLDGTILWPDAKGRRGGDVPGAVHSLAWAHWKLLEEMREAIRAAAPDAILGCLGNDYYDALAQADFVLKERMYFAWEKFAREFTDRETKVRADLDARFEQGEAPLVATRLAYGVKGYSSIAVQTARHLVRNPTGLWYLGTGDHSPQLLEEWLATVVAHASEELYVVTIEPPNTWLHFQGRDTIWADEDCRIVLSQPACVTDADGNCLAHQVTEFEMTGGMRYRLLHRCAGG